MNNFLFTLLLISSFSAFSQDEKVLYVVDSIPALGGAEEELNQNEIEVLKIVTDQKEIRKYRDAQNLHTVTGRKTEIDKIIFIITKEYTNRSEELKRMPTTKMMELRKDKWYLFGSSVAYSGPFIDYYFNGKKESDGTFKNGLLEGIRTKYNKNGSRQSYQTFKDGLENGHQAFFIQNDNHERIIEEGDYKNGVKDGLYRYWHSTGKLEREEKYNQGKKLITKEAKNLEAMLKKGILLSDKKEFNNAIEVLNKAIELNSSSADCYYYRGSALLNIFKFNEAINDFDKVLEIEPLFVDALETRALARIQKYESISLEMPKDDLEKVCSDLSRRMEIVGNGTQVIIAAINKYCKSKVK